MPYSRSVRWPVTMVAPSCGALMATSSPSRARPRGFHPDQRRSELSSLADGELVVNRLNAGCSPRGGLRDFPIAPGLDLATQQNPTVLDRDGDVRGGVFGFATQCDLDLFAHERVVHGHASDRDDPDVIDDVDHTAQLANVAHRGSLLKWMCDGAADCHRAFFDLEPDLVMRNVNVPVQNFQ